MHADIFVKDREREKWHEHEATQLHTDYRNAVWAEPCQNVIINSLSPHNLASVFCVLIFIQYFDLPGPIAKLMRHKIISFFFLSDDGYKIYACRLFNAENLVIFR